MRGDSASLVLLTPRALAAEVVKVAKQGVAVRHTSSHSLSRESSRAHAIFTIEVDVGEGTCGKLVFGDLAGSERSKKADGANVQETAAINKSLLMLSNCISALAGGDTRASAAFRNSKLTKLLMESLCGTGYTMLLAALSPAERHFDETANTLYFASKCSNIQRQTQMNLTPHEKEVMALKATIRELRRELADARRSDGVSPPRSLGEPPPALAEASGIRRRPTPRAKRRPSSRGSLGPRSPLSAASRGEGSPEECRDGRRAAWGGGADDGVGSLQLADAIQAPEEWQKLCLS